MAYPNSSPYTVIISQTSGSAISGQYPFVERIISGSNLFLVTDANGNLTGSTNIPIGSFTNLTVTGALTASIISASTAITSAAATFAGPVTMSATLSASGGITASNIYDAGTLTVVGTSTLGTVTATMITSSLSGSSVSTGNATIAGGTINGTSIGASVASTGNFTSITANSISSSVITSSRLFGTADTASIANALNSANTYSINTLTVTNTLNTNALSASGTSTLSNTNIFGLLSASNGVTASNIYDSGVLTVVGVTSLTNTTNNPNFSTTNGLYVVGGVTIAKDLWISGSTTIAGNLTLLGTGSIVNISSSTIVIGTNRIELNAGVPIQRYAGIDVFDSGSGTFVNQVTSSFLWDGLNDNWLLVSANSSSGSPLTQSSTIIIGGPSGSFGNETKLTNNFLPKSQASGKNIADSKVSDDGTILLYTGTTISGSQISASGNLYVVGNGASGTGSITYATGVLVTYATGSFNTLTITTGSSPGVGSVPATPTSAGMPGQINVDNNFIYVYTNSSWKRVPLSQWAV